MDYLLDTHAFIWWMEYSDKLSQKARAIIADNSHRIFLSHASQWEIAIKVSIGRLEFPVNELKALTAENGFEELAITTEHIVQTTALPLHHRDPFYRLLIAQVQLESLTLLSRDGVFPEYEVELLW